MMAAVKIDAVPGLVAFDDMRNPIQDIYIKRVEKKTIWLDKRVNDDRSNTNACWKNSSPLSPPSDRTKPRRKGRVCLRIASPPAAASAWRLAPPVGVHCPEPLLQKTPIDRPPQLHQRMLHVDDLVKP